ncbi:MAG: DUF423 domain-containing protein [Proteobacteria bacterium]|nr:MAG: DUF423 domain-containing protein [Pseudomonadota bacterium]TDJ70650.1 MAG: DUF423 domain-containing protein [Pseudomonadota bacterium]
MLSVYQTAVEYHRDHALGIILIAVVINVRPGPSLMRWVAAIMPVGIILFSGSLYLPSVSDVRWLSLTTLYDGWRLSSCVLLVGVVWWRKSDRPRV